MRRKGFTLVELLVVVAIIGLLLAILLPQLNEAMEIARRMKCAANLRGIFTSIKTYSATYKERWPTIYAKAGTKEIGNQTWGGEGVCGTAADGWKITDRGDENAEDETLEDHGTDFKCNLTCLWLLVREGQTQPGVFICPSDRNDTLEAPSKQPTSWWSFESLRNISYSYQNQYTKGSTDRVDAKMVVMADKCPRRPDVEDAMPPSAREGDEEKWYTWNSPTHGWKGQNCLFGDGHAEFMTAPTCGISENNIWIKERWDTAKKEWVSIDTTYPGDTAAFVEDLRDSWLVP